MIVKGEMYPSHYISDIQTTVMFGVKVDIPTRLASRSRDLVMAVQKGLVSLCGQSVVSAASVPMPVSRGVVATRPVVTPVPSEQGRVAGLRREMELMGRTLRDDQVTLQCALTLLKQLTQFAPSCGTSAVSASPTAEVVPPVPKRPDVVECDVPMFIPDVSRAAGGGRLNAETSVSDGDTVSEASRLLRQFKGRPE